MSRTSAVELTTHVLLIRNRFHIRIAKGTDEKLLLSEEIRTLAFTGSTQQPQWLDEETVKELLDAPPSGNVIPAQAVEQLTRLTGTLEALTLELDKQAKQRRNLLQAQRVRKAGGEGGRVDVQALNRPDLLGTYILLPAPKL